jgi:Pyruvate/2-oxoacid:ferredoxin oxidoreductase delta subunit
MQPAIDRGRCVHSGRVAASCIACLAACPRGAVRLDGAAPDISDQDCDGCGLCAAACPRGAISLPLLYARGEIAGHAACFAACEKAVETAMEGRIACLHAIGLDVLLRAMASGTRLWLVARGDCERCERGRGISLMASVERLNEALRARGRPSIVVKDTDAHRWVLAFAARAAPEAERRRFLGRYAAAAAPEFDELRLGEARRACFTGAGPVPNTIHLDQARCVACHACARICPDGAFRLEEAAPAYVLEHVACTGCGLCVDVCDRDAVRLSQWTTGGETLLPLVAKSCASCGGLFHSLGDKAAERCPVCSSRAAHIRPDRVWE